MSLYICETPNVVHLRSCSHIRPECCEWVYLPGDRACPECLPAGLP